MVLSRDGAWQPFGLCRIVRDTAVLLYNGKVYDFSDETLNIIYRDKGLLHRADGLIAHKGELYLLNTVTELSRTFTNISRIPVLETTHGCYDDYSPVETVATLKDCGFYFATANDGDDVYFVCTRVTENFGKLCLDFFDPDEVNEKLLSLFA